MAKYFVRLCTELKNSIPNLKGEEIRLKIFRHLPKWKNIYIRTSNGQCFCLPNFWIVLYVDKICIFFEATFHNNKIVFIKGISDATSTNDS